MQAIRLSNLNLLIYRRISCIDKAAYHDRTIPRNRLVPPNTILHRYIPPCQGNRSKDSRPNHPRIIPGYKFSGPRSYQRTPDYRIQNGPMWYINFFSLNRALVAGEQRPSIGYAEQCSGWIAGWSGYLSQYWSSLCAFQWRVFGQCDPGVYELGWCFGNVSPDLESPC